MVEEDLMQITTYISFKFTYFLRKCHNIDTLTQSLCICIQNVQSPLVSTSSFEAVLSRREALHRSKLKDLEVLGIFTSGMISLW